MIKRESLTRALSFCYKGFGLIFAEGYARKKRIILRLEIANYRAFSI